MLILKRPTGLVDVLWMTHDELDEVAANVAVLIRVELDVHHRLGGHPAPVPECPHCRPRPR